MNNMRTKSEIKQLESSMYRAVNKSMLSVLSDLKNEIKAEIKKELQEPILEPQVLQTENSESFHKESESSTEITSNKNFTIYNNSDFGELRTVDINGKPYFVANDIAKALGYTVPKDAVSRHCKGALKHRYLTKGGIQEIKIIPEGDVYRLVIKSKLPKAEQFEKWVFDEVLPELREKGFYYMHRMKQDSYMIEDPIERADRWKEEYEEKQKLKLEKEKLEQEKILFLEERIESAPKIAFHDAVSAAGAEKENQITVGQLSALLHKEGIFTKGRNRLFEDLRNYGYFCRTIGEWNKPTQKMIDKGYMTYKESYDHRKKVMQFQPFITGKGQVFFANEFLFYKNRQEEEEKERAKYLHKS